MKNDQMIINNEYDFDKLKAYEIKSVETNSLGEKVITLYPDPLAGIMRHAVRTHKIEGINYQWEEGEPTMVQILNGKPVAVIPTKNLLFAYKND